MSAVSTLLRGLLLSGGRGWTRCIAVIEAIALLGHCGPTLAQDSPCVVAPTTVTVTATLSQLGEPDMSESIESITVRQRAGQPSAQGVIFGVYRATVVSTYDADLSAQRLPDGRTCISLRVLHVTFGLADRRLYLASELAGRPCVTKHVVEHEGHHIALDEALLASFNPKLKDALESTLKGGGPAIGTDIEEIKSRMKQNIDRIMGEARSKFSAVRTFAQAKVDAGDEPEQLMKDCREEVHRLLNRGP